MAMTISRPWGMKAPKMLSTPSLRGGVPRCFSPKKIRIKLSSSNAVPAASSMELSSRTLCCRTRRKKNFSKMTPTSAMPATVAKRAATKGRPRTP